MRIQAVAASLLVSAVSPNPSPSVSAETALESAITSVTTLRRSCGAVVSELMSRSPSIDMCSVRGIGVAVSVSTWTSALSAFSRSL